MFTSFAPFTWIRSQCDVGLVHCENFIICRFSVVLLVRRLHHQIGIKFNENGSTKMLSGNVKTFSCTITNFLSKECRQTECGSSEIFGISCKRLVDTFAQRVRFVYDVMMAEQSDYINIWALFAGNERWLALKCAKSLCAKSRSQLLRMNAKKKNFDSGLLSSTLFDCTQSFRAHKKFDIKHNNRVNSLFHTFSEWISSVWFNWIENHIHCFNRARTN